MNIERVNHDCNGNRLRGILAAALLACGSLTHAGEVSLGTTFMGTQSGGTWTVRFGSDGTPLLTQASPGLPAGAGWQKAGNFGYAGSGNDVNLGGKTSVPVGNGNKLAVDVTGKATKASMGKALAKFAKAVGGPLAIPLVLLEVLGEVGVTVKGDTGGIPNGQNKFWKSNPATQWTFGNGTFYVTWQEACWAMLPWAGGSFPWALTVDGNGTTYRCTDPGNGAKYGPIWPGQAGADDSEISEQELADLIAQKSGWPSIGTLTDALVESIKAGNKIEVGPATVTVPTVQPEMQPKTTTKETTSTDPATGQPKRTVTTTTTTTICTPSGDKVVCGEKNVTTIQPYIKNPDGTETPGTPTTETTEETTDKPKEETPDLCEKHPDIVACQKLDTPTGEVPKSTREVTFTTENLGLGGGSCPAPAAWSDSLGTHSIDLNPYCNIITSVVRPLVLAFAALAALMLCMQGIKGD